MPIEYTLRTCRPDLTSHDGVQWPAYGPVEAPNWDPTSEYDDGLHGFARGMGGGLLTDSSFTQRLYPEATVIGATVSVGDYGHAGTGNYGHAIAGDYGVATSGDYGRATAGYSGKAVVGTNGMAKVGDYGMANTGVSGCIAGDYGRASAGHEGMAAAGVGGTISIERLDGTRLRIKIGYIGEGLLPGVLYKVQNGEFIMVWHRPN